MCLLRSLIDGVRSVAKVRPIDQKCCVALEYQKRRDLPWRSLLVEAKDLLRRSLVVKAKDLSWRSLSDRSQRSLQKKEKIDALLPEQTSESWKCCMMYKAECGVDVWRSKGRSRKGRPRRSKVAEVVKVVEEERLSWMWWNDCLSSAQGSSGVARVKVMIEDVDTEWGSSWESSDDRIC